MPGSFLPVAQYDVTAATCPVVEKDRVADIGINFHVGRYGEAVELVKRYHYSKRAPANVQVVGTFHENGGLFGDYGDAIAACFFSIPPTRWNEDVWELSRLVRTDEHVPLTGLIARTCKSAKRKGADLLVSFADKTQGHHGGIYQAASWNYNGARDRCVDGLLIDGTFWPGRSCNTKFGTRSPQKVSDILGREAVPHYDEGKHLYWRALTKEGTRRAERLGLQSLPYPKPDIRDAAE